MGYINSEMRARRRRKVSMQGFLAAPVGWILTSCLVLLCKTATTTAFSVLDTTQGLQRLVRPEKCFARVSLAHYATVKDDRSWRVSPSSSESPSLVDDKDDDFGADYPDRDSPAYLARYDDDNSQQQQQQQLGSTTNNNIFVRDSWLEDSTHKVLHQTPLGKLGHSDTLSILGLMAAWAKQRSPQAALQVEAFLVRLVREINYGNRDVFVSSKMYTCAMDAWAKSHYAGMLAAERAQRIHDGMVRLYAQTGDEALQPSAISYNTLINAWAKCSSSSSSNQYDNDDNRADNCDLVARRVEQVLQDMLTSDIAPNAVTFATMIDCYARHYTNVTAALARCEALFAMMDDLGVDKTPDAYATLQNTYVKMKVPNATERSLELLQLQLQRADDGYSTERPEVINFDAVLHAASKQPTEANVRLVDELLQDMERPASRGGYDVEPNRYSYALAILAAYRCVDNVTLSANVCERVLENMEQRALHELARRQQVSSAAPPLVTLDHTECFHMTIYALARLNTLDGPDRAARVLVRMERYAQEHSYISLQPTARIWTSLLHALARSSQYGDPSNGKRAEAYLEHMLQRYRNGEARMRPDGMSFGAVLRAYQRSTCYESAVRADNLVRRMEMLYEEGVIDCAPDVYHYTLLCSTWAKSQSESAPERCFQILHHMLRRKEAGFTDAEPNCRTYNALIDCLCRAKEYDSAEEVLFHMLQRYEQGDVRSAPDCFSFNRVIHAFSYAESGDGRRAEALLDRFMQYAEDPGSTARPEYRSFRHIINHYALSNDRDAPYRAEYVLNRLIDAYENGLVDWIANTDAEKSYEAFCLVMDAYARAKHPDAGENAERLLRTLHRLEQKYKVPGLQVNADVMNGVLYAWQNSRGASAAERSVEILKSMESNAALDATSVMAPNRRTYMTVLATAAHSNFEESPLGALRILQRFQDKFGTGYISRAYSLVISACARTLQRNGADKTSLDVACKLMEQLDDMKELRSDAFAYFFDACGRQNILSEDAKRKLITKYYEACRVSSKINGLVTRKLKEATTPDFYEQLLAGQATSGLREQRRRR